MMTESHAWDVGRTNEEWLELDAKYRIIGRYRAPVVLEKGKGVEAWDVEGNQFLDFESGQLCMSTGHGDPDVRDAILAQTDKLMQTGIRFTNVPRIILAKKLADITPAPLQKTHFGCTGSEANEVAIRLAKFYTKRSEMIGVLRGYHGRTLASFSLTTAFAGMRRGYGPSMGGVTFIPVPYEYRCAFRCGGKCDLGCAEYAEEVIDRATGEVAGLILEFIMGAGGVIVPPKNWVRAVARICRERGILLIADEALTGLGRTGKWFAFEHFDVVPDIVTTSKALGGGIPLCAVITSAEIADTAIQRGFAQSASHMGDPLQCAVGLANLDVIEKKNLVERAEAMGRILRQGLEELQTRFEVVGDVRGIGLLQGIELVRNKETKERAPKLAGRVNLECLKRGLIIGGARPESSESNMLRFAPPLMITEQEIGKALDILEASLQACEELGKTNE